MGLLFKPKLIISLTAVAYVWSLPFLSKLGFAEPNSNSISAFIANPMATGAMSAISFIPLTLIWEYQDIIVTFRSKEINLKIQNIIKITTLLFQCFYGLFLTCTYGFVPDWLHTFSASSFSISFMIHAGLLVTYVQPNKYTLALLGIGISSSFCMLILLIINIQTLWFWVLECVGMTSMFIFTPLEWYFIQIDIPGSLQDSIEELPNFI